jgi:hypothetical protein
MNSLYKKKKEWIASHKATLKAVRFLLQTTSMKKTAKILWLNRNPIIIGGCGRSGTTLLLSVLSCHPNIFAIEEETRGLCPGGYLPNPTVDAPFKLKKIYRYLIKHEIHRSSKRWCEKSPRNVLYFGRILRRFGKRTKIIQMVRDGRDVVTSVHPSNPSKFWITPQRWIQDVTEGRKYENNPQVLTIRYEDLVCKYESTVRRICHFIEEDFVDGFNGYPTNSKITRNVAWFEQAENINEKSIDRWKKDAYQKRVNSLLSIPAAGELLRHYGYDGI